MVTGGWINEGDKCVCGSLPCQTLTDTRIHPIANNSDTGSQSIFHRFLSVVCPVAHGLSKMIGNISDAINHRININFCPSLSIDIGPGFLSNISRPIWTDQKYRCRINIYLLIWVRSLLKKCDDGFLGNKRVWSAHLTPLRNTMRSDAVSPSPRSIWSQVTTQIWNEKLILHKPHHHDHVTKTHFNKD